MHGLLFGLETELAFSVSHERRSRLGRDRMIDQFFRLVRSRSHSLPDQGRSGMFFENGSRFYLDCGAHPELSTAECRSPAELVRWQLAGERLLAEAATELEKEHEGTKVSLFRCNVDYSGTQSVWGCHENYLYKNGRHEMPDHLIPHLVTRLVYTGAGGFNNRTRELEFLLSPRVPHLIHEISPGGSSERGIFHAKEEPLAGGGYKRLHLMCGESVSSQLSNYLKVGTTALVVRLIDAGVRLGPRLAFEDPLAAMRCYAADPTCRSAQPLEDGRHRTATQVQREYLDLVERHAHKEFMPEWTSDVCGHWRRVLDALEDDPESLATELDWTIKHALIQAHTRDWTIPPEGVPFGSAHAAELCEVDTRFGELGERGLFHALDRAGTLDHRIPQLGSIEDAMSHPPPGGRAEARGNAIRELHAQPERCEAGWETVIDAERNRQLDLRDPFEASPTWREFPAEETPSARRRRNARAHRLELDPTAAAARSSTRVSFRAGLASHSAMNSALAIRRLRLAIRSAMEARDVDDEALARFWCATAQHDAGSLSAVQDTLGPALSRNDCIESSATRVRIWSRYTLALIEMPARKPAIEESIERARQSLGDGESGRSRVSMLEGRLHGARGRYRDAIAATRRAIREHTTDPISFSSSSYFAWMVSFCLRSGDVDKAKDYLERWRHAGLGGGLPLYVAGTRGCAEADVACADGRPEEAVRIMRATLRRTEPMRATRWQVAIRCAAARSAIGAGEFDWARPILDGLLARRRFQVEHLSCEIHRLDAICNLRVAARMQSIAEIVADPDAFVSARAARSDSAELRGFRRAYKRALKKAQTLDDRLQTDRHMRELTRSIRDLPR